MDKGDYYGPQRVNPGSKMTIDGPTITDKGLNQGCNCKKIWVVPIPSESIDSYHMVHKMNVTRVN